MEPPLLQTKLHIPRIRQRLVSRPRLIERLNEGLHRKLTLIAAPAGYGKTTLISSWIDQLAKMQRREEAAGQNLSPAPQPLSPLAPTAWLSLDEADNDLTRFLLYLIAALQQLEPQLGAATLANLESPQPPLPDQLFTALVNDIAAFPIKFVLVLDDYHVISAPAVHSALTFLLAHQPANLHLVLTSRADPPLPLARLRVRGQLNELRVSDLQFNPAEIGEFFEALAQLRLSPDTIRALQDRTEGWAAGLQLAALSLSGKDEAHVDDFMRAFSGSHRYVLDYLAEEILQQQPWPVREFLLQTSILERLTGPLCDAVVENLQIGEWANGEISADTPFADSQFANSQTILEHLEQSNLFFIPLDDQREWYRYHHLFAEFLRKQLQKTGDPAIEQRLCRRAAAWSEQNGWLEEAIGYAMAAQDWTQAALWVEQVATLLWQSGRTRRLLELVEVLPAQLRTASPQLCLWYALSLILNGRLDEYQPPLDLAEAAWRTASNTAQLGIVYHVRTLAYFVQGHSAKALENIALALDHLPQTAHTYRGVLWYLKARSLLQTGQLAAAKQALAQAKTGSDLAAVPRINQMVDIGETELLAIEGNLQQALRRFEAALETTKPGWNLLYLLVRHRLAVLHLELNHLNEAETYLTEALVLLEQAGQVRYGLNGYLSLARLRWSQGQPQTALAALEQAELCARRLDNPHALPQVEAHRARVWLRQGRLEAITHWAEARKLHPEMSLAYERQPEHLTFVRLLLAQRQPASALRLLARLISQSEAAGRSGDLVELFTLKALAHQAESNLDRALAALAQALTLGEAGGYVRTFLDEGLPLAQLLAQFDRRPHGIGPTYLAHLRAAFDPHLNASIQNPQSKMPGTAGQALQNLIEPLSERELEVLRLIVDGASNKEIAQMLVISVNTVKKHITHIYGKLGVANRLQAVTRARELGLVG